MLIKWSFQHSEFHSNLFLFGVDVDWSSWIIHKLLSKVIYKRHEYTLDEGNFFSQRNCRHFIAWKVVEWNNNLNGILTIKLNWKLWARFFPSSRALYHFLVRFFAHFSRLCDILHSNDSIVPLDTRPCFWGALETKENSISRAIGHTAQEPPCPFTHSLLFSVSFYRARAYVLKYVPMESW